MGLRDIGEALPPGFRFYPNDEELVCHYLYQKIVHPQASANTLVEIDLHTCEPWQLPEVAKLNTSEWYFFSFRDRKYATGFRTNRATTTGYWKATGKDRTIVDPVTKAVVGMRKTLVFYRNRAPNGIKTSWIMHEFRLENPHLPPKEDWVLCRVFQKPKTDTTSSGELSPTYDTTTISCAAATATSPTFATSPPPLLDNNNNNTFTTAGFLHHHLSSFPDSPPHPKSSQNSDIINNFNTNFNNNFASIHNNGTNDLYSRLLFDMNFGVMSDITGAPAAVLEDMQFDGDGDDGSMIFI